MLRCLACAMCVALLLFSQFVNSIVILHQQRKRICFLRPTMSQIAKNLTAHHSLDSSEGTPILSLSSNIDSAGAKSTKSTETTKKKLQRDIIALEAFKRVHGHLRVPYWFVIPNEKEGDFTTNSRIRRKGVVSPSSTSFPTSPSSTSSMEYGNIGHNPSIIGGGGGGEISKKHKQQVIQQQQQQHNPHDPPPAKKEVVDNQFTYTYPEEVHGLRLGLRVARIRKGQLYTTEEHRRELASIGLVFDFPDTTTSTTSTTSTTTSIKMPSTARATPSSMPKFITTATNSAGSVSSSSSSAASKSHTAVTGAKSSSGIANSWSTREHSRMEKFNLIVQALKVHDDLFGDLLVPRYFVVPAEAPWPRETWGLQLGNRVRNIRSKRAYNTPFFHEILIDMGFLFDLGGYKMQFGGRGGGGAPGDTDRMDYQFDDLF